MPALFVGHGNPMNAIEDNIFTKGFASIAKDLPVPKQIICISAHWETNGTQVCNVEMPQTIHDFYGFPKELFEVSYPAPGDPALARAIAATTEKFGTSLTDSWGIDHGAWSVLVHMYPKAQIPVVQLSLNRSWSARQHFELAKELNKLRDDGAMIIGSGNLVHNLSKVDWKLGNNGYDWAEEANFEIKKHIYTKSYNELISYEKLGSAVRTAVPTPEHFLPLLYVLSQNTDSAEPEFFNDELTLGSLSMTSVIIR